uniref:C-X-C motif chemokine n=1 Tax=Equus asinus asinus TaxID=83772 RepID=A0A8C4MLV2_EQUAS
ELEKLLRCRLLGRDSPSHCSLLALGTTLAQPPPPLYAELRCLCVKTTSGIHPRIIQTLQVLRAGPHCSKVEVIATLKNGKEICLDPEARNHFKQFYMHTYLSLCVNMYMCVCDL